MRLNNFFNRIITFGLVLLLVVSCFAYTAPVTTAYANETQEIKLNVNSQTIVKGKSFSLYVYNLSDGQSVTYLSSDPAIASVDENGLVSANAVGSAIIFATVADEVNTVKTLSCEIKVGSPAISVQFSRLELAMVVGQKLTLERIVQPLTSVETPKFSSFDRSLATVSAGGRVTAKAEGTTYIFAQINNGRFAVCKINIISNEIPEPATNSALDTPAEILSTEDTAVAVPENESAEKTVPAASEAEVSTADEIAPVEETESAPEVEENPFSDLMPDGEVVDFETFIKRLNEANGKVTEPAESTTDNTNN